MLCNNYSGDLTQFLDMPVDQARERLQQLPKVGPKTADVLLSIWGKPTISVDTHVDRISKRLGLTGSKSKYEQVRSDLMRLFKEEDYNHVPLLFMAHGRTYCKARRPLCPTCPVAKHCLYSMKTK
jgi:endonuclease-3